MYPSFIHKKKAREDKGVQMKADAGIVLRYSGQTLHFYDFRAGAAIGTIQKYGFRAAFQAICRDF